MSKRVTAAAGLATTAALILAACGNGGDGGDGGDGGNADGTTPPSGDPVTITYMHRLPDPDGSVKLDQIVERWNSENPDIQVEAVSFLGSADEMGVRLETDINAGVGPCVAQLGYSELPEFFVRGLVMDVTEEAAPYEQFFSPGAWAGMSVGGVQLGIPQDAGPIVYFYNAAEFERLGIEVPTTPDEFIEAARVAAADGRYIDSLWGGMGNLISLSHAAGDQWFNDEDGAWRIDTQGPGSQAVAEFLQTLLDENLVARHPRWGDDFSAALADGSLIGYTGPGWNAGFMLDPVDGTPNEGNWRIAPIPDFGAGNITSPDGGSGVAIMSGCEHPAEAVKFSAWLNQQVDDLASQGLITVANEAPETSERSLRQFGGQDIMSVLVEATGSITPNFKYAPGMEAMFAAITPVLDEAVAGTRPVADALVTAQETMIARLRDIGLPVAE